MNMKSILALAAVAVATVAGASTNYVKQTVRYHNVVTAVSEMSRDSEFADPAAFRAALVRLEIIDSKHRTVAAYHKLRKCRSDSTARGGNYTARKGDDTGGLASCEDPDAADPDIVLGEQIRIRHDDMTAHTDIEKPRPARNSSPLLFEGQNGYDVRQGIGDEHRCGCAEDENARQDMRKLRKAFRRSSGSYAQNQSDDHDEGTHSAVNDLIGACLLGAPDKALGADAGLFECYAIAVIRSVCGDCVGLFRNCKSAKNRPAASAV